MEGKVSGRSRNLIFYVVLLCTMIGLVLSIIMGNKQDEAYKEKHERYKNAEALFQQGNYKEAERQFAQLINDNSISYQLYWKYALCLAAQQKYDESSKYFLKAQKQRPFIVRDQKFVVQYGEVLYRQGKYEQARRYIEEGQRINTNPELTAKVQPLIDDINTKLNKN